ncbi:hypothetical protein M378DRAFT_157499, partial [Amanita muscaria Koide BX008]
MLPSNSDIDSPPLAPDHCDTGEPTMGRKRTRTLSRKKSVLDLHDVFIHHASASESIPTSYPVVMTSPETTGNVH